jgi:hypothetical protein
MKLHLKEDVRDMVDNLLIIKDQYKKLNRSCTNTSMANS